MGRFDAPLFPFQPQQAWLHGTVLIVEFNHESAECDLVTAARIRMRGRPVPVVNRGWVSDVLYAWRDDKSTPARWTGASAPTRKGCGSRRSCNSILRRLTICRRQDRTLVVRGCAVYSCALSADGTAWSLIPD
jgi:hypothetical protein